jgi:ABC-type phosphate/phosphonate transport system substrate-binding protein
MKWHSANRTSAGLSWTQRTMMIVLAVLMIFTVSPEIVQNATAAKIDPKLPPLKIAFIPFENPEQLVDNVGPAIAFLEKQLGRKIRHFTTLNYSSAVEALNAGKADISFM